jgi:hypothetical protein
MNQEDTAISLPSRLERLYRMVEKERSDRQKMLEEKRGNRQNTMQTTLTLAESKTAVASLFVPSPLVNRQREVKKMFYSMSNVDVEDAEPFLDEIWQLEEDLENLSDSIVDLQSLLNLPAVTVTRQPTIINTEVKADIPTARVIKPSLNQSYQNITSFFYQSFLEELWPLFIADSIIAANPYRDATIQIFDPGVLPLPPKHFKFPTDIMLYVNRSNFKDP